jgi:hypothetical protein
MVKLDDQEDMEGPVLMKCVCSEYFKDSKGQWHQPGTVHEFDDTEGVLLIEQGRVKSIEVQTRAAPADRMIHLKRRGKK